MMSPRQLELWNRLDALAFEAPGAAWTFSQRPAHDPAAPAGRLRATAVSRLALLSLGCGVFLELGGPWGGGCGGCGGGG